MSVSGIIVLIALTVGALAFIAWPLITQPAAGSGDQGDSASDVQRAALSRDYKATLSAIRDLDFDYQTGKLTADDYGQQRELLVARGAEQLHQIDTIEADEVEAAIAQRRASQMRKAKRPATSDPVEMAIAARRQKTR